jgi:hypothetical protein
MVTYYQFLLHRFHTSILSIEYVLYCSILIYYVPNLDTILLQFLLQAKGFLFVEFYASNYELKT